MEDGAARHELVSRNYRLEASGSQPLRLFFQPERSFYHRNFDALSSAAGHLAQNTEIPCCRMVRTISGSFTLEANGERVILMMVPGERQILPPAGRMLARFHQETRIADISYFSESPLSGKSAGLAGQLDRLGEKFRELEGKSEYTPFERIFLANFAYFAGCAENALQYLVNLTIDEPEPDPLVLTHRRLTGIRALYPENPANWVAEDRSRDLSDWLRALAWRANAQEADVLTRQFLDDYEAIWPLTRRTAASVFARLLFPQAYIACCEQYFFSERESGTAHLHEALQRFEDRAPEKERLLMLLAARYPWIPVPEWVSKAGSYEQQR
ncbi:spore coat protein YutH [Sporolactobacillus vineae]|uniref:spore coat protein YutH n=1 Tax=Sporolactobacillus vineae TaxID=444463 RepID=UPI000288B4D8|nr:spore coat protein YutH [Sporolactobacillus vineae]